MKSILLFLSSILFCFQSSANIRLPKLFGNSMVLQRGKGIPVWGWADAGERITVQFNTQQKTTKAGKDGRWMVTLNAEAGGGPYQLAVAGKNKIVLTDVLVGEVWICSGQSNMEMTVANSANAAQEIKDGTFPQIRHIKIPNIISGVPLNDISDASWQAATPETVGNFSAVAYYFARKLQKELGVPVGLINSSWGGSMVETWISREALENSVVFKGVFKRLSFEDMNKQNDELFQKVIQEIEATQGKTTNSAPANWSAVNIDEKAWRTMALPGGFDQNGLQKFDGTIWFRKRISLDKQAASGTATLNLSTIDDKDETYVNGIRVGGEDVYSTPRQYGVPDGVLKEGENIIAVRLTDNNGNGGFFGKPAELNLICNGQIMPLAGDWVYKIETIKKASVNPNIYPTLLFNAMINPLIPFAMQGVLWYQGETNASRAQQYKTAFPLLINDWRNRFRQGAFPFYFVQLASFSAGNGNSNKGSSWAELREAQTTTLSLPNTGMAITLDIGETADIHPKNKQDVGARLAAIALHNIYKKETVFSGPTFTDMHITGNKATITFANAEAGFLIKDAYGYIKGFEVAGADKKFYLAKASIINNRIVVSTDSVAVPVAVRYGWADDMPEANVYNKQGFPAVPFRTDTWITSTADAKYEVVDINK